MRQALKKYLGVSLLTILSIMTLHGFIVAMVYSYILEWTFCAGALSIFVVWIIFFVERKWFNYTLTLVLLLGATNIIEFSYWLLIFSVSWTPPGAEFTSIKYNPLILLLFIVFVIGNFTRIMGIIGSLFSRSDDAEKDRRSNAIQNYVTKLEQKSDSELQEIIENPRLYQPEFVEAAQLLLERNC